MSFCVEVQDLLAFSSFKLILGSLLFRPF